jgi:hypothetical protein
LFLKDVDDYRRVRVGALSNESDSRAPGPVKDLFYTPRLHQLRHQQCR